MPKPLIRQARPADAMAVGEALRAYLVQTEREKIERGVGGDLLPAGDLPAGYHAEVEDPLGTLSDCLLLVAELDRIIVGLVVLKPRSGSSEVKRLWASPDMRGHGIGSALLEAAIAAAGSNPVTLTVWDWRRDVVCLYESRGFVQVSSWDERPRLLCLRRDAARVSAE